MRDIYFKVGELIKIVQYIEYNLAELMEYLKLLKLLHRNINVSTEKLLEAKQEAKKFREKLIRRTLGNISKYIEEYNVIPEEQLDELKYILNKRNDLIHQYFKRKDFEKHSENYGFLITEKNYLDNFYRKSKKLNDFIFNLVNEKMEEYNQLIMKRESDELINWYLF